MLDAAELLGRDEQEAVVGPDVESPVSPCKRHGPSRGPDPGVDDREVDSDRHVRKRVGEDERALEDALRGDAMGDVDDLDIRRDSFDDAVAGAREVVLEPEVGQERDEAIRDAASLTAAVRPSTSCVSASSTTSRPPARACAEVTGPIVTQGAAMPRPPGRARPRQTQARRDRHGKLGNLLRHGPVEREHVRPKLCGQERPCVLGAGEEHPPGGRGQFLEEPLLGRAAGDKGRLDAMLPDGLRRPRPDDGDRGEAAVEPCEEELCSYAARQHEPVVAGRRDGRAFQGLDPNQRALDHIETRSA